MEKGGQGDEEYDLNTSTGRRVLINKYGEIGFNQDKYFFHESIIHNFENRFIQTNEVDEAIKLLGLHIQIFTESFETYYVFAHAYAKKGDNKQALETLKKSLPLDPNNKRTRELLKKIEAIK